MKKVRYIVTGLIIGLIAGITVGYGISASSQSKTALVASNPPAVAIKAPNVYDLWNMVNAQRTAASLDPLVLSTQLDTSAINKCNDMVASKYWAHDSPTGKTPWDFINQASGTHINEGENLYEGWNNSSSDVVTMWMKSPEHRSNVLNGKYTHVGYATCTASNYQGSPQAVIVVQHLTD